MSAPPFLPRFEAMVRALRADPRVEVYDVVVNPPADEEALRAAESALGVRLPDDLRAFYRAHDGIFLEWGLRDGDASARTAPFDFPDYGQPPGCINLLPFEDALSTSWEEDSHVNEIPDDLRALIFGSRLDPEPIVGSIVVDNFSKYNHGDLILGPTPVMVVSTDHGADMDSSDFATFSTYLDLTLAVHGLNRYYFGLGCGWSRSPRRVDAWPDRPSLDDLLARLAEHEG